MCSRGAKGPPPPLGPNKACSHSFCWLSLFLTVAPVWPCMAGGGFRAQVVIYVTNQPHLSSVGWPTFGQLHSPRVEIPPSLT